MQVILLNCLQCDNSTVQVKSITSQPTLHSYQSKHQTVVRERVFLSAFDQEQADQRMEG